MGGWQAVSQLLELMMFPPVLPVPCPSNHHHIGSLEYFYGSEKSSITLIKEWCFDVVYFYCYAFYGPSRTGTLERKYTHRGHKINNNMLCMLFSSYLYCLYVGGVVQSVVRLLGS